MFHKLLFCLILSFMGLVNASSIIRKSIQYIPKIENVAAVDTTTKQIFNTQNGKIASEYKRYLETGKGNPLLFNLITDDSLKHGYKPLGLTAESVQQIKYFLEKYTLFINTVKIFAFNSLPSWLAEQYENITDQIFLGIDYKEYDLGPDDICQGVGEVLASRFLKNKYSFRPYFYWRKNFLDSEESAASSASSASAASAAPVDRYKKYFIKKEQEEIKDLLRFAEEKNYYQLMSKLDQKEIERDIQNFDKSIKYLIVLETELSQSTNIEFLKKVLQAYPNLVIIITFQDHVISIQDSFLSRQDIFKHLIIAGKNLTQIGDYFLFRYSSLQTIDLPSSLTQVGNDFLSRCSSLQAIDLPSSLTQVGDDFLYGCSSLQTLDLPQGITQVGDYFLSGCSSLQTINLPDSLTQIGNLFLFGCSSLQTLDLPSSLTQVGDYFLSGCIRLQTLYLPSTLTQVGSFFLDGCTKLVTVKLSETLYQKIYSNLPRGIKYEFYSQTSVSAAAASSAAAK